MGASEFDHILMHYKLYEEDQVDLRDEIFNCGTKAIAFYQQRSQVVKG